MAEKKSSVECPRQVESLEITNGPSPAQLRSIVLNSKEPLIFAKASLDWPCLCWTPEYLANQLGSARISFRICAKIDSPFYRFARSKIVMETDCLYVDATLLNYCAWLSEDFENAGALARFQRTYYWCYADYKYMTDIFQSLPALRRSLQWSSLGFPEITGDQSTIWIGSEGSSTPCHLDTYGCNLVAQVYGKKKWCLFPPSEISKMYPTRIPYEESSIFSQVNINNPDFKETPQYSTAIKYEVVLEPGDVLLVPRHWWHFVESLEPSISINTWIPLESDHKDRICEAVTRTLVCSMKFYEGEDPLKWLNPNENTGSYQQHLEYIQNTVNMELDKKGENNNSTQPETTAHCAITPNDLLDAIVSPQIVSAIVNQVLLKAKHRRDLSNSVGFKDISDISCTLSGDICSQRESSKDSCTNVSESPNIQKTFAQDQLEHFPCDGQSSCKKKRS